MQRTISMATNIRETETEDGWPTTKRSSPLGPRNHVTLIEIGALASIMFLLWSQMRLLLQNLVFIANRADPSAKQHTARQKNLKMDRRKRHSADYKKLLIMNLFMIHSDMNRFEISKRKFCTNSCRDEFRNFEFTWAVAFTCASFSHLLSTRSDLSSRQSDRATLSWNFVDCAVWVIDLFSPTMTIETT